MRRIKLTRTISAILLTCFSMISPTANAAGNLTDAQFFGVWSGSSWTNPGMLDYSYNSGVLSAVEDEVKDGDYAGAKTALLTYFQNRTNRTVPQPTYQDTDVADLACDLTFIGPAADYLIDTITVGNSYATHSVNVLDCVKSNLGETNKAGFFLMGKDKADGVIYFNSREQANNKPTLEVVISGTTHYLTPEKDSYIVGNSDTNFGTSNVLQVKSQGVPYDSYERRAYLVFDLSSLPQSTEPTSATFKLYGYNASSTGDLDVNIFYTGNTEFDEAEIDWLNTKGNIYSWQDAAGGCSWNNPDYADDEYLYVITRHGFLMPMLYEHIQNTIETYYCGKMIEIMDDFLSDKAAGYVESHQLDCGLRASIWVRCYHYLKDCSLMDANQNTDMVKFLWQMANFLAEPSNFDKTSNWGVIESKGLYEAAVYFPEFAKSNFWKTIAETRLNYMLANNVNSDSSFAEASTNYAIGVMKLYSGVKEFGQLNSQSFSAEYDSGVQKFAKFIMDMSYPDGMIPQYGDSDYVSSKRSVYEVGDLYSSNSLKYFGSGGEEGSAPDYTSVFYPVGKLAFMRTGWDSDDLFMHLNNSNLYSHGHPDLLSPDIYGYENRLIIDPGRYTYNDDSITAWFRTSALAHNVVVVDDNSSAMVKTCSINQVPIWVSNDGFDFIEAYNNAYSGFTSYRDILFVKPDFWIVSDTVVPSSGTHDYAQLWHFLPDADISLDGSDKASTDFSQDGNIQVVPADPASINAQIIGDGANEISYYSKAYGILSETEHISYEKADVSGTATFDTVLYPTDEAESRNVTVARLSTTPSVSPDTATAISINMDSGNNGDLGYYYLSKEEIPSTARTFGGYNYDGKMAYIQTTSGGSLVQANVVDGKALKQNTTDIITCGTSITNINVIWEGSTVYINGDGLGACTQAESQNSNIAIEVYAPSATTVVLNGQTVTSYKSGNYVYAAKCVAKSETTFAETPRTNASASSTHPSYSPANVIDENEGSMWTTTELSQTGAEWVCVDMGANYNLKKVTLIPRKANGEPCCFPVTFKFQYSTNGTSWTDVPNSYVSEYPAPTQYDYYGEQFVFDSPVTARYLRVAASKFSTDPYDDYYFQLTEIYTYQETTQASRFKATASSTLAAGYNVINIKDGKNTTFWISEEQASQTGNEWVCIDMGGSYDVSEVRIVPRSVSGTIYCFPVDFKIRYSNDGVNWTDAPGQTYTNYANPTSSLGEVFTFTSQVTARFIKIEVTKFRADNYSDYYVQLAEVSIY